MAHSTQSGSKSHWFRHSRHGRPKAVRSRKLRLESLEARCVMSGGSIAGTIFHDIDGSGAQDAGEPGISGATVFLDTNKNGALDAGEASTATLTDGSYQFDGLPAGNYTVAQVLPNGWVQTAAGSPGVGRLGEVTQSITSAGTGAPLGITWVNGMIYQVENNSNTSLPKAIWQVDPTNGAATFLFNSPGQTVRLSFDGTNLWGTDPINDKIYQFTTGGTLLHAFVAPGPGVSGIACDGSHLWVSDFTTNLIYELDVSDLNVPQLPVVRSFGTPAEVNNLRTGLTFDGQHLWLGSILTDRVYQIDRTSGQVVQSFAPPRSERLDLYLDVVRGSLEGITFDGQQLWYADAGLNGYLSDGLVHTAVGRRLVRIDPGGDYRDVTVVDGQASVAARIGNSQVATISGRVFYDANQDGDQDAGEIGLAGRQVFLDFDGNAQQDTAETTAITDTNGNYQLAARVGGTYTVGQVLPPVHWRQVSPAAAPVGITSSGQAAVGPVFADFLDRVDPLTTDWVKADGGAKNLYTGLVWQDPTDDTDLTTFNGAQSVAEASTKNGFSDWRAPNLNEAQLAAINGVGSQDVLDWQGYWWTSTTAKGGGWAVNLRDSTGAAQAISKSNYKPYILMRDTGTVIDDGAAGYSDSGGWTAKSNSAANGGDYRQRAAGNGSQTATWTYSGLTVGASYKLAATWFAASANASNAPYTVRDGAVVEATVAMNQKVAANDFDAGGTMWEGLGTFTADTSTFTVTLSNAANGTVVADAVRLFKVYDSFVGGGAAPTADQQRLAAVNVAMSTYDPHAIDDALLTLLARGRRRG